MNLFDLLHEYQHLRAKAGLVELEESERKRWQHLSNLMGNVPGDRRRSPRFGFQRPLPVLLIAGAGEGFQRAKLREVGVEGAALELDSTGVTRITVPLLLLVDDEARGLRFELPALVAWQTDSMIGLRFEGMPRKRALTGGSRAA